MKSSVYAAAISLAVAIGVIEVQASPYWSSKNDNYDCVGNSGRGDCQESCHRLMRFGIYNATREQLCTGNDADMLWKWQNCYRCSCKDGSYLMADGKTCSTDNIGCEGNNGLGECQHSCLNLSKLWGSYNASIQQLCTDNDATTLWKQKNCYRCSCKDGFYLMADGKNCKETTCDHGYFRCPSDGFCISNDWRCDGEYDCQDKTDEIGCPNAIQNCTEKCQNGGYCNAKLECVCESQWEGEYCHLTVCNPACQNNGICNATRTCDCASGWKGAHCHLKGKPPYSLWLEETNIVSFTKYMYHKSREAFHGVWIKGGRVYKIFKFTNLEKVEKLKTLTDNAITSGVPTPKLELIGVGPSATWYDENSNANKVTAAVADQLVGTFFQLSKPGHITILVKLINESEESVRKIVKESVTKAIAFKISDPQGFFNANGATPISFIDIHKGSIPSSALTEVLESIKPE